MAHLLRLLMPRQGNVLVLFCGVLDTYVDSYATLPMESPRSFVQHLAIRQDNTLIILREVRTYVAVLWVQSNGHL